MSARFTWRKQPEYDGLRRLPDAFDLRLRGETIAVAQRDKRTDLWFWYGDGINTAGREATLPEVKAEAVDHFKRKIK